jgi:hypothetical protein
VVVVIQVILHQTPEINPEVPVVVEVVMLLVVVLQVKDMMVVMVQEQTLPVPM